VGDLYRIKFIEQHNALSPAAPKSIYDVTITIDRNVSGYIQKAMFDAALTFGASGFGAGFIMGCCKLKGGGVDCPND
jgi:hypothetical protein